MGEVVFLDWHRFDLVMKVISGIRVFVPARHERDGDRCYQDRRSNPEDRIERLHAAAAAPGLSARHARVSLALALLPLGPFGQPASIQDFFGKRAIDMGGDQYMKCILNLFVFLFAEFSAFLWKIPFVHDVAE